MDNRIILVNEQQTNSPPSDIILDNCPVLNDIDLQLILQVSDIIEPESGTGSRTISFEIPGTPEVDLFLEDAFSLNVNLQTWNPNLKTKIIVYKKGLIQFEGYLQVLSIEINETENTHAYKCNALGEVLTLFTKIKGKQLQELAPNFSIYNHPLTATSIANTWTNPTPVYVYPLLDRGQAGIIYSGLSVQQYAGNGCFMVSKYIEYIFLNAGMTYTSAFLDSAFFKTKLCLTPTRIPRLSASVLANNKFLATPSATQTLDKFLTNTFGNVFTAPNSSDNVNYATEVYDAGNVFVNPTYTPAVTNNYNVKADFIFRVTILDAFSNDVTANYTFNAGTIAITVPFLGNKTLYLNDWNSGASNSNVISIEALNKYLVASTTLTPSIEIAGFVLTRNSGANAATLRFEIIDGSFSSELANSLPFVGQTIEAADMIPDDYTQDELLSDIKKMFNLQFTADKTNPNNVIIEPYNDFYLSTPKDWTYKHDKLSTIETIPTAELEAVKFKLKYQDDGDYFNKKYLEDFKETYGTQEINVVNDFIKNEKTISTTKLAATTLVGNQYSGGFVISTWRDQDATTIKEFKAKPRILYWGGLIGASNNAKPVKFASVLGVVQNTYPYAGHLDNPYNPQIDLSFGLVKYVYFTKPNQFLTNNNLYNKYYSRMFNQIIDKNSKIVRTNFYLNEEDIHTFDFRFPIFTIINDEPGSYLVNKIINTPKVESSSVVELLKLVDYPIHTPQSVPYENELWNTDMGQQRSVNQPISTGFDNTNYSATSSILGGSGNFIPEDASEVQLINSVNVIVQGDVENFVGIGLSNRVIDTSYSNTIVTNEDTSVTVASDTTLDKSYHNKIVYVDATAGNVTLTWDCFNMEDARITIIRIDAGLSDVLIDSTGTFGTENYIGNGLPFNLSLAQYATVSLTSKSDTIYNY